MPRSPEVDEWIKKTLQLTETAITLSGQGVPDQETQSMMREVQSAATTLLAVLGNIRPVNT